MKINFKTTYVSIKQFESFEISDFSVLTGINGSGKTHLLNAIKQGNVEIEGFDKSEIVYYNYNDFTVFAGKLQQSPQFQNKENVWNSDKKQFFQKIQNFKNTAAQLGVKLRTPKEQVIFNFAQQSNFNFRTYLGNSNDFELLRSITGDNILEEINSKQKLFTPKFFEFINQYLNGAKGNIEDVTIEKLKALFDEQKKSIEEYLENENQDLYDFLKKSIKDKSIFSLNVNDFESPNLFLEDIANEERDYQFLKTQNILNKAKALDYNENVSYLEAEDFIKQNGLSPIEQINHVLSEYDCNGYFLYTNPNQQLLGIDKKNINIKISLKHSHKNYETTFDQLSSGEKTLIALSLLIYKTRKKRIVPRVLLLDEIDSSLHPSMIDRLLGVIQNLFVKEQGFKVILATHSPTTVALADEDDIYVVNKNGKSFVEKETKQEALKILSEGFITLDEGLQIFDQFSKKELTIFTEGNNISFISKAIELLDKKLLESIDIVDNLKDRTGKNQLKTLFDFFTIMPHKNKVLFICDCDVNTSFIESNDTYSFTFDQNPTNSRVKKGIENLFSEEHFKDEFYPLKQKDDGGTQSSLDKPKFENYILNNATKEMFKNFDPLIKKIDTLLRK